MFDRDGLQARTKDFALRALKAASALPKSVMGKAVASQLIRSGTSVGANYRAARRARSTKEFAAKLGVVVEEADETLYWLEIIRDASLLPAGKLQKLLSETDELVRIFSTMRARIVRKRRAPAAFASDSPVHHLATSPLAPPAKETQ